MGEPLKTFFSSALVRRLATELARVHPAFPIRAFVKDACRGLEGLELLDRGRHIARTLGGHLPPSYPDALAILLRSLGPGHATDESIGAGMAPFFYLPHTLFVAERGLEHFDVSMQAQYELTKRFTAEGSIRPYLARDPGRALAFLQRWAGDENPHVRRLVSEGTRLRLPWAPRVPWLDRHPELVLGLLERLKDDVSTMVRCSVANNLNDLGKVRPDLLLATARTWLEDASPERRILVGHALRTAVKRGEAGALALLGYGLSPRVSVEDVAFMPRRVRIGGRVAMTFGRRSTSTRRQPLLIDVAVHFVKARGVGAPKVFKLERVALGPRQRVDLKTTFSLAVHTARTPSRSVPRGAVARSPATPYAAPVRPMDTLLYDPDDLRAAPADRSLVVRPTPGRPLDKDERAFNRALARLRALSRALDEEKDRLDRLLVFHAAEIRPRCDRAVGLRAELVRALTPFLDDRRLTRSQRGVLRRILVEQLDDVLTHLEQPDADLRALFERLHDISYARAVQDDMKEVQAGMAAMFNDLGLDVDVPELRADMTDEDAAAVAAQMADAIRGAEARRDDAAPPSRRGKAARAAEDRARRQEQLRKDSLGAIYHRLAREVHPDLEHDPGERDRKSRVMQDVTAAYASGDLHALLQLELEWLGGPSGEAARASRDILRAHTELLKQQAAELAEEARSLRFHPRYAALVTDEPFGFPMVVDGPREVERFDAVIAGVQSALDRLSSPHAVEEVRGAIREYRDAETRRARTERWRR